MKTFRSLFFGNRRELMLSGASLTAASLIAPSFAANPAAAQQRETTAAQVSTQGSAYQFIGGFPTPETVQKAYDDADLNRAIQSYRFFYPAISALGVARGMLDMGLSANKVIGLMQATPKVIAYTPNSDTPYAPTLLNLRDGPISIEMPPGPLICAAVDLNMRWVGDMGVPGPDAGNGGKHLLLPPGYSGQVPAGYHAWKSTTNTVLIVVRSLPVGGDIEGSLKRIRDIKIQPLNPPADWTPIKWLDIGDVPLKGSAQAYGLDGTFAYWEALYGIIDSEPPFEGYRNQYGELAVLGIAKGKPFAPDARMKSILEQAARIADAQMRVQSFADRRPDRLAWPDRKWEWAALRFENGDFDMPAYVDLDAREKWFYQATWASPAMFRRSAGAGSLYWLGLRDKDGVFLDGSKTYKLTVPLPVPNKLFWSVTVYDAETRSEVVTDQNKGALRSLFELKDKPGSSVDLNFGPSAPAGHEGEWIKTIPGKGWFVYFRIYGPEQAAFDGSWKPGDFTEVK